MEIHACTDLAQNTKAEQLQCGEGCHDCQQQQRVSCHICATQFHEDGTKRGSERQQQAGSSEAAEQSHRAVEPLQAVFHNQQIQQHSHGAIQSVFGSSTDSRTMICADFSTTGSGMLEQDGKVAMHFAIEFDVCQEAGSNRFEGTAEIRAFDSGDHGEQSIGDD